MVLALPARDRSFYAAAPLVEVICQVRFPKLLALESGLPVSFQDAVASEYPILETRSAITMPFPGVLDRDELPLALRGSAYDFFDETRETKITLASDFIAVTTARYQKWEDFRARIRKALEVLLDAYEVRLILRSGLRYQNVIRPASLGLEGVPASDLLIAELLGPASTMGDKLREHQSTTIFDLDNGSAANLGVAITSEGEPKQPVYVVDCDVFNDNQIKADLDGTLELLESLHGHASHLFRWCIREALHGALDPKPC